MSKKVILTLPQEAIEFIEHEASRRGVSLGDALRTMIANERYLRNQIANGSTVLLQWSNDRLEKLNFN